MWRNTALAMVLIGVVGCGRSLPPTLAGGKPINHWIQALKSDPDPKVRKEAAFKLGNVGDTDPEAMPALIAALQDRDARVRCEAILALMKFGSSAQEAVPRLTELRTNDRDSKVRTYAARALDTLRVASNESASTTR